MKKKIIFVFAMVSLLLASSVYAADEVTVTFSDGIYNASLKSRMEKAVSRILTEVNAACEAGRELDYSSLGVSSSVQNSLSMLWENAPFYCLDDEIIEHCLTTGSGYQIRNIGLQLEPLESDKVEDDELYQEAVISFDKKGNVTSFYFSISQQLYANILKSNMDVTDLRRRQLILDYVEQFRTAYNQKDLDFLEKIFSENTLIITGKVIKNKQDDVKLPDQIVYKQQSKREYLTNLKRTFAAAKYIKVTFDDVQVKRHGVNPDIYSVTVRQGYTSNFYHDDGILVMIWDFKDERNPQIHVRTWQPMGIPEDKVFKMEDFDIY